MFNSNDFLKQKEDVIEHFNKEAFTINNVCQYGNLSGIPYLVLYKFIAEEFEEYRELCYEKITALNKFYGI